MNSELRGLNSPSLLEQPARRIEILFALLALTTAFAYIYPELFFLKLSPMGGNPLTLKDPTVSWSAFMPAFRDFRYELLEHGNILWSNLRAMGQPILGNTVQGAPLFPLNLALLPLPDSLYWSVMPISRIILIGLGCFMVARRLLGLSFAASLFFALLIGFNINTLRWINHPTSNGLLAGIWYFYFACRICLADTAKQKTLAIIGFSMGVFAMITTGFPEAAAMAALLFGILFIGFVINKWHAIKPRLMPILGLLIGCHLVGLSLSAIQIFALIEYVDFSAAMELRSGYAGGSYKPEDLYPYTLAQLSSFGPSSAHQSLLTFSMGLWGLFFAIRGLVSLLTGSFKRASNIRLTAIVFAAVASMSLFVAKAFGLSELVKQAFIATPILAESHFPLYFSPLFFICFAIFAAIGLHDFLKVQKSSDRKQKPVDKAISIFSTALGILTVLGLSILALGHFHDTPPSDALKAILAKPSLTALKTFLIATISILMLQLISIKFTVLSRLNTELRAKATGIVVLALLVFEVSATVSKVHFKRDFMSLTISQDAQETIQQAFAKAPHPKHELRGANQDGDFVSLGLATLDNGVSAMLPPETRRLRIALFNAPYGGYLALKGPIRPWSYQSVSTNLVSIHATPKLEKNWNELKQDPKIESQLTQWPNGEQALTNPLYFQGRSTANIAKFDGVSIWLHFKANDLAKYENQASQPEAEFWIKANVASQSKAGSMKGRDLIDTKWRVRMPAEWLHYDSYSVTLRQVDRATSTYADSPKAALLLNRDAPEAIASQNLELLAANASGTRHFYFDKSALPRAYIAAECLEADTIEEEFFWYRKSDAVSKGTVIFPAINAPSAVPCETYSNSLKRVAILDDNPTEMRFETIKGPALLQLNDTYYPGWSAYEINQQGEHIDLDMKRANTNGRSVYLPESRDYQVTMAYKPFWLNWVYGLLLLGILILALMIRLVSRK